MTVPATTSPDQTTKAASDLDLFLAEHIWGQTYPLRLAGDMYEPVGDDEVSGYEDDADAILLRRKSDGQVFEVDLDVTIRPARPEGATRP